MTFQFIKKRYDMNFTIKYSRNTLITYYSKQKMEEIYPKGDYEIIGEIGNTAKRFPNQDRILTETGNCIPIFPRGSSKKPFEWVSGYAAVSENTYVAVIRSMIPQLFIKRAEA